MASDYCYSKEMARALQRNKTGDARVIPVLLRSTYWEGAPFAELQMLPDGARPVATWYREKHSHFMSKLYAWIYTKGQLN
jgi:hypothetical protein